MDFPNLFVSGSLITLPEGYQQNAPSDYLTAFAIDKENSAAHRGVERIVERYAVMSREATGSGQFDKASGYLEQARFVLDAMKLRKWLGVRYDRLFHECREAGRVLAAARRPSPPLSGLSGRPDPSTQIRDAMPAGIE